jgi:hypothetical protein
MSQITSVAPAVLIEVDIKPRNSPIKDLAIKKRLEQSLNADSTAPTLEDIEQKLKKAEEFRREEISKKLFTSDEKLSKALERKSLLEKEEKDQADKIAQEIESKLEKSEQLR